MFSLNELDSNIISVGIECGDRPFIHLPNEEALLGLDYRLSKMIINCIAVWEGPETNLSTLRGKDHLYLSLACATKFKFISLKEGTELRWQCEPSTVKLWHV